MFLRGILWKPHRGTRGLFRPVPCRTSSTQRLHMTQTQCGWPGKSHRVSPRGTCNFDRAHLEMTAYIHELFNRRRRKWRAPFSSERVARETTWGGRVPEMPLPEHWEQVHGTQLWWGSGTAGPCSASLQAQRDGRGSGSQHICVCVCGCVCVCLVGGYLSIWQELNKKPLHIRQRWARHSLCLLEALNLISVLEALPKQALPRVSLEVGGRPPPLPPPPHPYHSGCPKRLGDQYLQLPSKLGEDTLLAVLGVLHSQQPLNVDRMREPNFKTWFFSQFSNGVPKSP